MIISILTANILTLLAVFYLLTILVAVVFFLFGIYGLSAANEIGKLPSLKSIIFSIAGIYLLLCFTELILGNIHGTKAYSENTFSLFAVAIGFLS